MPSEQILAARAWLQEITSAMRHAKGPRCVEVSEARPGLALPGRMRLGEQWHPVVLGRPSPRPFGPLRLARAEPRGFRTRRLLLGGFFAEVGLLTLSYRAERAAEGGGWLALRHLGRPLPRIELGKLLPRETRLGLRTGLDEVGRAEVQLVGGLALRRAAELVSSTTWQEDDELVAWLAAASRSLTWSCAHLETAEGRAVTRHVLLAGLEALFETAAGRRRGRLPLVDLHSVGSGRAPEELMALTQRD